MPVVEVHCKNNQLVVDLTTHVIVTLQHPSQQTTLQVRYFSPKRLDPIGLGHFSCSLWPLANNAAIECTSMCFLFLHLFVQCDKDVAWVRSQGGYCRWCWEVCVSRTAGLGFAISLLVLHVCVFLPATSIHLLGVGVLWACTSICNSLRIPTSDLSKLWSNWAEMGQVINAITYCWTGLEVWNRAPKSIQAALSRRDQAAESF